MVTDYRVFIPLIDEIGDEEKCVTELKLVDVDDKLLAKSMFLCKAMLYEGARKCIVYFSLKSEVDQFFTIFSKVAAEYFGLGQNVFVSAIYSGDCQTERQRRLKNFENFDGIGVMLSIQCLSEGVDIPCCDSIFMATPCRNKIR